MAGWIQLIDSSSPLSGIGDVVITSVTSGEILAWTGSSWENQTLAELGIAPSASPSITGTASIANADFSGIVGVTSDSKTLSSGAYTPAGTYTTITSESGTADDLTNITAGTNGDLQIIRAASTHTITVKTTGNINTLDGDIALTSSHWVILICDGTDWNQIGGSIGYPTGGTDPTGTYNLQTFNFWPVNSPFMNLFVPTSMPNFLILAQSGMGNMSTTGTMFYEYTLPPGFDGSSNTITIRMSAAYSAASNTIDQVDCIVYANGAGSDLCTTGAQTLTGTYANYNFTVTPTGLSALDRLAIGAGLIQDDSGGFNSPQADIRLVQVIIG